MKQQTIKICLAALRVFVDAMTKGHDATLHIDELNNSICRQLRFNKTKEKKNTRGTVVQVVKVLREHRILCAMFTGHEHDLLKRFKPVDSRNVYSLSREAYRFLTSSRLRPEYTSTSDATLRALLHKYGVIPPEEAKIDVMMPRGGVIDDVPVTIEADVTVAENEITEPEPTVTGDKVAEMADEQTEPTTPITMQLSDTAAAAYETQVVNAIVAMLQKLRWSNQHTPRALLGALRAVGAFSAETSASASMINWEPHMLRDAAKVLNQHNLLSWRKVTTIVWEHKKPGMKHSGAYLTELGRKVAEAGNYVDDRDAHYHIDRSKEGGMLKNDKKLAAAAAAAAPPQDSAKAILVPTPGGGFVTCFDPAVAVAVAAAFNNPGAPAPLPVAAEEQADTAVAVAAPPQKIVMSDYGTIAGVVGPTTKALFESIQKLLTGVTEQGPVEALNGEGLYYAISELQEIIGGLKYELCCCLAEDREFDMQRAMDYCAQVELEMEQLLTNKSFGNGVNPTLSLMRDQRAARFPKRRKMPDATKFNRVVWEG